VGSEYSPWPGTKKPPMVEPPPRPGITIACGRAGGGGEVPDTWELMLLVRRSRRDVLVGPRLGARERLRLRELGLCGEGV
jgi:hypothetical protein